MPRKSAASFELGRLNVGGPFHIEVPTDLPASIKGIVTDIIASQAPQHFREGDGYLLEQYAQAIVAGRKAFAKLEKEGYTINNKTNPWVIVLEKAHRSSVALAAKLRLAPQQRMDQEKAAREHSPSRGIGIQPWRHRQPSAYDTEDA